MEAVKGHLDEGIWNDDSECQIMSIISLTEHQVVKDLNEPSEINLVHLDIYAAN